MSKHHLLSPLFATLGLMAAASAQTATLVRDIEPGRRAAYATTTELVRIGTKVFFSAAALKVGQELFVTDGTAAGTKLVKDIHPTASSRPSYLCAVGTTLYFVANDGTNGNELWKSDGTPAGTILVKDINPRYASSNPRSLEAVGSTLFFAAFEAKHGYELWKSDGTATGTTLVKDLRTGASGGISPSAWTGGRVTHAGNKLFFVGNDGTKGSELWVSDGTSSGTVLVKDINPGAPGGLSLSRAWLTPLGSKVVFSATDGSKGYELWQSDGTAAGTQIVKDIYAGTASSTPLELCASGSVVFFQARTAAGIELWKTDATALGTVLVKDITAGSSSPFGLVAGAAGSVWFSATTSATGRELFTSDGTSTGTRLVKDVYPGTRSAFGSAAPRRGAEMLAIGSRLYFAATDGKAGTEIWTSDGTSAGTHIAKDLHPGTTSGVPAGGSWLCALGSSALFAGDDGNSGSELFKTQGTPATTSLIKNNLYDPPWSSRPKNFATMNGIVYFQAVTRLEGSELWRSDGTSAGTRIVRDIQTGTKSGNPYNLVPVGNTLFFTALDASKGAVLMKSDGTRAGTVAVQASTGSLVLDPRGITAVGQRVFLSSGGATRDHELWVSDGSRTGTHLVKDIYAGASRSSSPTSLHALNGKLLFRANDGSHGSELWISDGTLAGTTLVKDIRAGTGNGAPLWTPAWVVHANHLYFTGDEATHGKELWKTDGTSAGTVLVKDARTGTPDGVDTRSIAFTSAGSNVYFGGYNGASRQLWQSDGSALGTKLATFVPWLASGLRAEPLNLVQMSKGRVFFVATRGITIAEPWVTGGTQATTYRLAAATLDWFNGFAGPERVLTPDGGRSVWFSATNATNGFELWKTDGSTIGTIMVTEKINPGAQGSRPQWLTAARSSVFFAASDPELDQELWKIVPGASAQVFGSGCSTATLLPTMRSEAPVIGTTFKVSGANAPAGKVGFVVADNGFPKATVVSPGCTAWLARIIAVKPILPAANATWSTSFAVPNDSKLVGVPIVGQTWFLATSGSPIRIDMSNGVLLTLGR